MFPVAYNNPIMPSLSPSNPPLQPAASSSYLIPVHRGMVQGGGGSVPPKVWTCHRPGSGGGCGSLPPELLPCPARDSTRSGSGGWYISFHCMGHHLIVGFMSEVVARTHVWYCTLHQCMHIICQTDHLGTRSLGALRMRLGGGVVIQPEELYPPTTA